MFDHGDQVLWHRFTGSGVDQYGDPAPIGFEDVELTGVGFAPESTVEPRDGASQRVVSEAKLYLSEPIDYSSQDEFTVRGVRFEVEGDAAGGWMNPFTGWSAGQEILLRRVTG
jgi:hypothetical protein